MAAAAFIPHPAPAGLIPWFDDDLRTREHDFQIYVDPDTKTEILVGRNTVAVRQRFQAPRKPLPHNLPGEDSRESTSTPHVLTSLRSDAITSSQAYGSEPDEETLQQLEDGSGQLARAGVAPLGEAVYSVTNRNRTRMRKREQQKAGPLHQVRTGRVQKRGRALPLERGARVGSATDDDTEGESDAGEEDTVVTRWFAAVAESAISPALQAKMVKNAMAIAGPKAIEEWETLMAAWQKHSQQRASQTAQEPRLPEHLTDVPLEVRTFYVRYNQVDVASAIEGWRAILHRIRMVHLWHAFTAAQDTVLSQLPPAGRGQDMQSRRRVFLFGIIYPEFRHLTRPHHQQESQRSWKTFVRQLEFAQRWDSLQAALGSGVLGMIPHHVVSNTWIQRGLLADHFRLWIQVIKHFNPGCIIAASTWCRMLNQALPNHHPRRDTRAHMSSQEVTRMEGVGAITASGPATGEDEGGGNHGPVVSSSQGLEWAQFFNPGANQELRELEEGMQMGLDQVDLTQFRRSRGDRQSDGDVNSARITERDDM